MGQEASLPQANGDDLEDQARAPPSSVNPPVQTSNSTSRPGTRMIGTMLHRAANHKDFEGKESARAAALAGQMPFMTATPHYGNGGPAPHQHTQQQQYPNVQHMTQEEQQYYQQQQGHHGPYPDHNQMQTPQHLPTQQQSPPHGSASNVNVAVVSSGVYTSPTKGGRGKALFKTMKNLNISGTLRSGVQGAAHAAAATASVVSATAASVNANVLKSSKGGASEWETRWDEDDDDSDGEDDETKPSSPIHPHSPVRPGIDDGHNSMSPIKNSAAGVHTPVTPPKSHLPRANVITPVKNDQSAADDGIEWDTGAQQDITTKPNVQMFLPLLRVLGKGSFGKVVLVQKNLGKERGSLFAMKILRKTHLVKRRQIERTRTERKVLSAVNHPFIMKLHYAFQTPEKLYLVLDYCPGGELFFHLSRHRFFPEGVARFYAAELLLATGHLHKRGIIYRDLKPENVLLDAEGHVKLGDFGLAKAGLKHPCEGATSMCGTPEYMAPEVLCQQGHGFCVDYWGLGMLLYEMMTGLPPWYTTDRAKLFRRLKSAPLDIPSKFSPQAASCVSGLLERNPRRRLGVAGVRTAMEHEFFRSINWRALYGRRVEAPIRPCEGWKPPEGADDGMNQTNASTNWSSNSSNIDNFSIDAATANFDNTFTRMPVHTEEGADGSADDAAEAEQLSHDTFVGFSFDDRDREAQASGRPRAQNNYNPQASPQQPRTLD